ncbi:hypothetical protein NHQ30_004465 [Ciborinia camelliae]|nr:hypothetical protein NHQ30_004465 [Ciborinia camelliae]
MTPAIILSDMPTEKRKSIGMAHLWDKMRKVAAAKNKTMSTTEQPTPPQEQLITQPVKSDTSFIVPPTLLQNSLLDSRLLRSPLLAAFSGIHNAGWIRMEFRAKDQQSGQVRVYILPDDVGRGVLDRSMKQLRKGMEILLDKLDLSHDTWQGTWTDDTPIQHIDPSLNEDQSSENVPVFDLFNNIPSPKPDPDIVADEYVQDVMRSILEGSIQGLHPDTKLHPYQSRTAAMMLQRETQPGHLLDPRLQPIKDQAGNIFYCNLSASTCFREPIFYEAPRGGICAENMGLGKTLICLALILSTKDLSSQIPVEHSVGSIPVRETTGSLLDMAASTIGRLGIPWETVLRNMEYELGDEFNQAREALRRGNGYYWYKTDPPLRKTRNPANAGPRKIWLATTTLVIVPANLIQQWVQEIEKHTIGLKYLVMINMKTPLPAAEELSTFDIILFSKQRFEREAKENTRAPRRTFCSAGTESVRNESLQNETKPETYRSPLKDLHFKRLITDEGHSFGNATRSLKTDATSVIDFLHLDARWIISGTPTRGLHGIDLKGPESNENHSIEGQESSHPNNVSQSSESYHVRQKLFIEQDREDLEKLGNILSSYLKARPWANTTAESDQASWVSLVIKPRYDNNIHGDSQILKTTLEGMIIRHTTEDVNTELSIPPLYNKVVYLDGCLQDKLCLNIFSMMIAINAVTSEREGLDYLFHPSPRSRRALQTLVSNLRQASFTWSGYSTVMIESSLDTAKKFVTKDNIAPEDKKLLVEAIQVGEFALANGIFTAVSRLHEMAMYVHNPLQKEIKRAWALDYHDGNPTLMGASMVLGAKEVFNTRFQKWVTKSIISGQQMMEDKEYQNSGKRGQSTPARPNNVEHKPTAKRLGFTDFDDNKMWENSTIISTASSKLSYLMDQISLYYRDEKIIIFYEAENVGYYIGQALKCMNVEYLVYSKRDSLSERSKCVVNFNSLPAFRVMLMDVNQAAFGLDMSAASRVYFINPVFSPQIEAQAIKRVHRIGQFRPVYVETLVLKGSIEEVILTRRGTISEQEHMKFKNILDDQTMYDWIRNIRFYPIPDGRIPGPDQFAILQNPQLAFVKTRLELHLVDDLRFWKKPNGKKPSLGIWDQRQSTLSHTIDMARLSVQIRNLGIDLRLLILDHFRDGLRERMIDERSEWESSMTDLFSHHQNLFSEDNAFISGVTNLGGSIRGGSIRDVSFREIRDSNISGGTVNTTSYNGSRSVLTRRDSAMAGQSISPTEMQSIANEDDPSPPPSPLPKNEEVYEPREEGRSTRHLEVEGLQRRARQVSQGTQLGGIIEDLDEDMSEREPEPEPEHVRQLEREHRHEPEREEEIQAQHQRILEDARQEAYDAEYAKYEAEFGNLYDA